MKCDGINVFIGKIRYPITSIYCDICGWGDMITHHNILANDRSMDFCRRHKDDVINAYIEMGLPEYNGKNNVDPNDKDLLKKQHKLKL